jgi:hypothetical protein
MGACREDKSRLSANADGLPMLTNEHLSALLAERLLGWRAGPDRYIMADRQWLKRERFRPTKRLDAAFRLLIAARPLDYKLEGSGSGVCWARVRTPEGSGEAKNSSMPLAICLAIARALGIEVCDMGVNVNVE